MNVYGIQLLYTPMPIAYMFYHKIWNTLLVLYSLTKHLFYAVEGRKLEDSQSYRHLCVVLLIKP